MIQEIITLPLMMKKEEDLIALENLVVTTILGQKMKMNLTKESIKELLEEKGLCPWWVLTLSMHKIKDMGIILIEKYKLLKILFNFKE